MFFLYLPLLICTLDRTRCEREAPRKAKKKRGTHIARAGGEGGHGPQAQLSLNERPHTTNTCSLGCTRARHKGRVI